MKGSKVIRIGAAAEPGTRAYLVETLRTLADLAEAGEVDAVAIAYLGQGGRHGRGIAATDDPDWDPLALIGAVSLLHHQMLMVGDAFGRFEDGDGDGDGEEED